MDVGIPKTIRDNRQRRREVDEEIIAVNLFSFPHGSESRFFDCRREVNRRVQMSPLRRLILGAFDPPYNFPLRGKEKAADNDADGSFLAAPPCPIRRRISF